jgi:hypothetical protein
MVEYREVSGFPGYRVGDDGTVWSSRISRSSRKKPWQQLVGSADRKGRYRAVILCHKGVKRHVRVAALVLEVFGVARPAGHIIKHLNDDRADCRLSNLAVVPCKGVNAGVKNPFRKFTEYQVREIRERYSKGETITKLARERGVGIQAIWKIVNRVNWRHIA